MYSQAISRFGMTSEGLLKHFSEKEHVAVVPGSAFGFYAGKVFYEFLSHIREDLKKALVKIQFYRHYFVIMLL